MSKPYHQLLLIALIVANNSLAFATSELPPSSLKNTALPKALSISHKVFTVVIDNANSDGYLDLLTTDRTNGIGQIIYQKTPRQFESGPAAKILGFHPNGLTQFPGTQHRYILSAEGEGKLKILGIGEQGEFKEIAHRNQSSPFATTAFSWPGWGTSIAVAPYEGFQLHLLRNFNPETAQTEKEFILGDPKHRVPGEVTAADLNGDGITELLYTTRRSRTLWRIDYPKDHQDPVPVVLWQAPVGAPRHLVTADLNGDGALDILLPLESERRIAVLLNDGKGHFTPGAELPVPTTTWGPQRLAIAEEQDDSLLLAASTEKSVVIYRIEKGMPYRFKAVELPLPARINQVLMLRDIDGDGHIDLLFTLDQIKDSLQILYGPVWQTVAKEEEPSNSPVRILARVGNDEITLAEFQEFVLQSGLGDKMRTEAGQAQLLRQLIEESLLNQAIKRDNPTSETLSPEDYATAIRGLAEANFPVPPVPENAILRSYYDTHKEDFGIPEMVRLVQIQFRHDRDQAGGLSARQRAEQALQRIEAGEDFNKVAKELTENPNAEETGPERKFVARNATSWLRDALQGLQAGQRTGIVTSPVGYEILLLTDTRPALIAEYEAVRPKVAAQWQGEQQQQARKRYLKTLAERFGVTVLEKGLENANPAKE